MNRDSMELSGSLWWLFILDTILIAAGGYVINDIFDQQADLENKPENQFIGKNHLSVKMAWFYYFVLIATGFIIATYIAYEIEKPHLLLIYPAACALLFLYSYSFKKHALIGNVVVAIFCAFVPGIILYAEWEVIHNAEVLNKTEYEFLINMFTAYISFAFLSTMVREIVKDIEDIAGDTSSGYRTLPIALSKKGAKYFAIFFGVLLILSYAFWILPYTATDSIAIFLGLVSIMVVYSIFIVGRLSSASVKDDYRLISKQLKILMVISLFVFLCIPFLI